MDKVFKALRLFLLLALVAIGILLLVSRNHKMNNTVRVEVDASIEEAFDVFMDPDFAPEWFVTPGMELSRSYLSKGNDFSPGNEYTLVFNEGGKKEFKVVEQITDCVKNERYGFDINDQFFNSHIEVSFEEIGGKTVIAEKQTGEAKGVFNKAMMNIMDGAQKKAKQEMYNKLGEIIERESTTN